MSFSRNYHLRGDTHRKDYWHPNRDSDNHANYWNRNNFIRNHKDFSGTSQEISEFFKSSNFEIMNPDGAPSAKRRRYTSTTWGSSWNYLPATTYGITSFSCNNTVLLPSRSDAELIQLNYLPASTYDISSFNYNNLVPLPSRSDADAATSTSCKRGRTYLEDDEVVFMSKDEIERLSPSRKDGIDVLRETHLRYTYCTFLQNLGMRLDLPQTTIGTAMVLCHRFFVRRSHACHDRFLIATAALFLTAKSEETARPLSDLLRASCETFHKQDISLLSYVLPVDWFEQYRERVLEAEQLILTTLNFELNVQHPFDPLTSVLNKLGLSQTGLLSLALSLISEGLRSSLWLQFKPQQIAAGAAYLAARSLKMDLAPHHSIWHEFQVTPSVIQDVANQLMELF